MNRRIKKKRKKYLLSGLNYRETKHFKRLIDDHVKQLMTPRVSRNVLSANHLFMIDPPPFRMDEDSTSKFDNGFWYVPPIPVRDVPINPPMTIHLNTKSNKKE